MTFFKTTPIQSKASVSPIASPSLMLRLWCVVLKPLGLGLVGMGMVAVPMGQAQTSGSDIKLLEPAGLASVQSPSEAPSPAPEITRPSVPQVAAPEIVEAEVEPMPPIAEKPDPLPPAMAKPAAGIAAKPKPPTVIARPGVVAAEPERSEESTAEDTTPEPGAVNWGPVTVDRQGVQFSPPAALKPYFSGNLKLPKMPNLASLGMMFPLSIPSPITSFFGWRVHPITGDQRVHTGTDIAAPMGTPVLAAMSGKVLLADFLGGYGIAVALEHGQGSQQTLYAHLSELFVKPGQVVQKGAVIGRVGTTGNSTGPHLHFEMRQQLPDGSWIAVDAGQQLEVAMLDLTQALKVAKQPQSPSSVQSPFSSKPQQVAYVRSVAPPIALKAQPPIAPKTKSSVLPKSLPPVKISKLMSKTTSLRVPTNTP
jgi:murein DD-endopeptidase MepM/ murein hydrolase activator NlpD